MNVRPIKTEADYRAGPRVEEPLNFRERGAIIGFSFDGAHVHNFFPASNGCRINAVIFRMSADEPDIDYPKVKLDGNDQPVRSAFAK